MQCRVRDVNIYYEVYGEGTPIVMIHGWGPDHRLMKGCMEPVFQTINTPWKRIYFDLPGMGKTKGEQWITGSDQMLDLVLDFIDAVIPNQNFVVAGESYGGYLARGIINKRPSIVDGLLLICPVAEQETLKDNGAHFEVFDRDDILLNSLTLEDKNYFVSEGINAIQNKRVWERFNEEILPGLKIADHSFLENYLGQRVSFSFNVDALEKPFMKPTLMLTGRQDSIVGYNALWKIIEMYPRASFVLFDRAGHNLQIEQDTLFTETVKEWLYRVL
ncbi:pimeloyl-ACP methyl ester carboxylesterase [Paenibacillus anaericanus]|uniref:alpha/beta fold hydrolase n=1 Tax=Paenibacillus anaericanus TaxID=170367 RepID=UPI002788B78D|nr:alpha/beta hydrolase [Paenibacillus anaericanus]MDQ0092049.1 pimeloyl-ACP methyl ester carboxylesterase [Paenibacillus anaericanus]